MMSALAGLAGTTLILSIMLIAYGLKPHPVIDRPHRPIASLIIGWQPTIRGQQYTLTQRTRSLLIAGVIIGVTIWITTGWAVAILFTPALLVGIPALLRRQPQDRIHRLQALDTWVRGLAGLIISGHPIDRAIRSSHRSAPDAIRPAVDRLVRANQVGMPLEAALYQFADDVNEHAADVTAAYLIAGSRASAGRISVVLRELANAVGEEVRNTQRVQADRQMPQTVAKAVAVLSIFMITGLFAYNPAFLAAYKTPKGQLLAVVFATAYIAILTWLQVMARGKPPARALRTHPDHDEDQP